MKLYYCKSIDNFGDNISPFIIRSMLGKSMPFTSYITRGKLLAVGSILKALRENDTVWGTGAMYDEPIIPPNGVKFLAVRGPLTRDRIQAEVPEVYGDPALLMPKFYQPKTRKKNYKIGVTPHIIDHHLFEGVSASNIKMISLKGDPRGIIDQMVQCETIISTSLHGIIVAEAYGIPAVWLRVSDNIKGGDFKFNDYFLSTGRDKQKPQDYRKTINNLNIFRLARLTLPEPKIDTTQLEEVFNTEFRADPKEFLL